MEDETSSLSQTISIYSGQLTNFCSKVANKLFYDNCWHSETEARQIIISDINDPEFQNKLKSQRDKIMLIYDRLAHISNGYGGTWADGLDKELLLANSPDRKRDEEETEFPNLAALSLNDIFRTDEPEEEVFPENQEILFHVEPIADPKGKITSLSTNREHLPRAQCYFIFKPMSLAVHLHWRVGMQKMPSII